MLRRWLLILLAIGLAAPPAFAALPSLPCPMQAEWAARLAAGDVPADERPDCCNDAETFAATGQACQAGQECGAPLLALPLTLAAEGPAAAIGPPPAAAVPARVARPPADPWRPPTDRRPSV